MNIPPHADFDVSVRRQAWEEEPEVAQHYEGIFAVSLNHALNLMFVPATNRDLWPPTLPEDTDAVASQMEARVIAIALSRYVVTPYEVLAGQEELFAREWSESGPGVLFYVGEAEFATFSRELSALADQRPSVQSGWQVAEIADLAVTRFMVSRVLGSSYVA
jgi:hypothetical protein